MCYLRHIQSLFVACRFCSTSSNERRVFNDLDMLKTLTHRVVVRTVDLEALDTGNYPATVPTIIIRQPGDTRFYEYIGQLRDIDQMFIR